MAVTADELAQLEERLLAKLQQPSRVEEEEELPAAVFARVTCVTTILLVYVCVSMVARCICWISSSLVCRRCR